LLPSNFAIVWRKRACSSALWTAIVLMLGSSPAPAIAQGAYSFRVLDTLGGYNSYARGINDLGQVVGYSYKTPSEYGSAFHATLWSGSTPVELGVVDPINYPYSIANSINNAGQVVGYSGTGSSAEYVPFATVWTGTTASALTPVRGDSGIATSINDSGQVVGAVGSAYPATPVATRWNSFTAPSYGTSLTQPGYPSYANGINNAGLVVGYSSSGLPGTNHATVWNGSTATLLNDLGATNSVALGINESGQVVGLAQPNLNCCTAILWDGTSVTDLGAAGVNSAARAINNVGQIVGVSGTTAALWNGTTLIDLNSFLSQAQAAQWRLFDAFDINEAGSIVGDATNQITGETRGFVLSVTPVPEPEAYLMFGIGIAAAAVRSRKRSKR
jgi:probable HAF family extracellular repeat protein